MHIHCTNGATRKFARYLATISPIIATISCDTVQVVSPISPRLAAANVIQGTCVKATPPSSPGYNSGGVSYDIVVFNASCHLIYGTYYYGGVPSGVGTAISPQAYAVLGAVTDIQQWCFIDNSTTTPPGTCFNGAALLSPGSGQGQWPVYMYSPPIPEVTYSQVRSYVQQHLQRGAPFHLHSRTAAMGDRG